MTLKRASIKDSKKIYSSLRKYAETHGLSLQTIAERIGVTVNTVFNWKKGKGISQRKIQIIHDVMTQPGIECQFSECAARNASDTVTLAMLEIWNSLASSDRARIYAASLSYLEEQETEKNANENADGVMTAAEAPVPFNN